MIYIHRNFRTIDNVMFLINITYTFECSTIILHNFTMHPISNNVVGENIVKKQLEDFDDYALDKIYQILIDDGIFKQ